MPVLILPDERLGMKEAQRLSGRDPRTIRTMCAHHRIGHQTMANAPWEISAPGLVLVMHGDLEGLEALRVGDRENPRVRRAIDHAARVLFRLPDVNGC